MKFTEIGNAHKKFHSDFLKKVLFWSLFFAKSEIGVNLFSFSPGWMDGIESNQLRGGERIYTVLSFSTAQYFRQEKMDSRKRRRAFFLLFRNLFSRSFKEGIFLPPRCLELLRLQEDFLGICVSCAILSAGFSRILRHRERKTLKKWGATG